MSNFRSHVVNRADALRLSTAATFGNELRQPDITDLDDSIFKIDVGWLEVTVNDAAFVQVVCSGGNLCQHFFSVFVFDAGWFFGDHFAERSASNEFHDDELFARSRLLDIKDAQQV